MKSQLEIAIEALKEISGPKCGNITSWNIANYALREIDRISVCRCGHQKQEHIGYKDHEECLGVECECDKFYPHACRTEPLEISD